MRATSRSVILAVPLLALASTAAAGQESVPLSCMQGDGELSEEASGLPERVDLWWRAREKRDQQALYELYDVSYRASTPFSDHVTASAVRDRFDILSHCIESIEMLSADRAYVFMEYEFRSPAIGTARGRVRDTWRREAESWFKEFQEPRPPFRMEVPRHDSGEAPDRPHDFRPRF